MFGDGRFKHLDLGMTTANTCFYPRTAVARGQHYPYKNITLVVSNFSFYFISISFFFHEINLVHGRILSTTEAFWPSMDPTS